MMRLSLAAVAILIVTSACDPQGKLLPPAPPQASHFAVAVDPDGNAWRLDTQTGEMWKCWQGTAIAAAAYPPRCFRAVILTTTHPE